MTDIQGALVNSQMDRFDEILGKKNEIAKLYFEKINNPKITLPFAPTDRNHNWQTYHILLNDNLNQNEVIQILKDKNIGSNYGVQCIPAQTYYANKYQLDSQSLFSNAYRAYTKGIAIPLYEKLTESEINYISKTINEL